MDSRRALAFLEPIPVLRRQIEHGIHAAGCRSIELNDLDETDPQQVSLVIAYLHRGNIECCRRLIKFGTVVVALHDRTSNVSTTTLLSAGVHSVLPRGETSHLVRTALAIDDDQLVVVPRTHIIEGPMVAAADAILALTEEERTWLVAAASGHTVGHIARETGQSERTLQRRLRDLYQRLSAHNLTEALVIAAAWGLVGPLSQV